MMSFYSYRGIDDKTLDMRHNTTTGECYTLRHNENLKVEMAYLGKGSSNTNSQGWERDNSKYFNTLYQNHPEMFSKKNVARLNDGKNPIIDKKMILCNPEWAEYKGQPLIHHHIGGNGEAVAVPKNTHIGQGGIHNYEKSAGITENCKNFSARLENDPNAVGKTTSQLHEESIENVQISMEEFDTQSTETAQIEETQIQVSMEEVDAQATEAVQSQQMDNDESVENEADNDTSGINNNGGMDVE